MHDAAGADAGDTATVEITRVEDEPEIRVPLDLSKALAAVPRAQAFWSDITPMARRDWILWISSGKRRKLAVSDRESLRHARMWKATSMLFWRSKLA